MTIRIIGAGLGRTGTHSLKLALEQLGFNKCYHMIELLKDPERVQHWEAVKRGGDVHWDKLFAGYQAAVDFPSSYYYPRLLKHYPDAKVILSVRDPEAWYESAMATIYSAELAWRDGIALLAKLPFSARARQLYRVFKLNSHEWHQVLRFKDKAVALDYYQQHNEKVMQTVPRERLLIFDVKEGWQPLTNFLNVGAPACSFPHSNDRQTYQKLQRQGVQSFLNPHA